MKELFWLNEGSKVSGVSDERHLLGGCSYISEILRESPPCSLLESL
jgi:hypothetical protein